MEAGEIDTQQKQKMLVAAPIIGPGRCYGLAMK